MKKETITAIAILSVAVHAASLADSFSGRLRLEQDWRHTKTIGASTVKETFAPFVDFEHSTGTNAFQMNVIVRETATLTNAQTRVIDLFGGISDSFGDATTFKTVRFLCVTCPADNLDAIVLGAAGPSAWASWCGATNETISIRPGGAAMLLASDLAGYAVAPGAGELQFRNAGTNENTYSVYIGGVE